MKNSEIITTDQKYKFLCEYLSIKDWDHWERDGVLTCSIYLQALDKPVSIDEAVIAAMYTGVFEK